MLGDFANIYSMAKINIGSSVSISQGTFLCCGSHDISSLSLPLIAAPIRIENHVWICADSMIAPGVTISEGSVIAARSNVIDDVAPWVVSGGNPSKQLRIRKIKDS